MEGVWQVTRGRNFFGTCVLKVLYLLRSIDPGPFNISLLKYFQTNSSLPKPDGFNGCSFSRYHSCQQGVKQVSLRGKIPWHQHPSEEHMKASLPRKLPQSTVWRQFTTSLANQSLKESIVHTSRLCRCFAFTGSFLFILLISWLWYMVGVTIYVNVHACTLCQWPYPCRLVRLFHESFLREIFILWQFVKVFSLESFLLYRKVLEVTWSCS